MDLKTFIKVELSRKFNSRLLGAGNAITSVQLINKYFDKCEKKVKYSEIGRAIKALKKEGGIYDLLMNDKGYFFATVEEFNAYIKRINKQSQALNNLCVKYKYLSYSKIFKNEKPI